MNAHIVAIGNRFEVIVNLNEKMGWVVHTANCCNRDDGVGKLDEVVKIDDVEKDDDDEDNKDKDEDDDVDEDEPTSCTQSGRTLCSLLQSNWIVPLIKHVITVKPNATMPICVMSCMFTARSTL